MVADAPVAPSPPRLSAAATVAGAPRTPPVTVPAPQTGFLPAAPIAAQEGATPLPETTSPVATAMMPVTTSPRVADSLKAGSEHSIAPVTSGPRVAPAIGGASLVAPPPGFSAALATALMPVTTSPRVARSLTAGAEHSIAPVTSGPRVAPAIGGASLVAPPPPGFSVALATAMGTRSADSPGLADSALGASEQRGPAPLATTLAPPVQAATAGQDMPRQIAVQIAQAAAGGTGGARGTVELNLSPEELGRVRLRLQPSEAGLSVTITADRPETLDLMRRNIDLLAREFLDIGYEDAQFDFAQGGQDFDDDDTAAASAAAASALTAAPPDTAQTAPAARFVSGDRLDIRL